tara:strand:- start:499 stop:1179 length:681 start_codon:yes stop_codon:yes gene_type:complete
MSSEIGLQHYYEKDGLALEVGVDEAGRGPMLGRVYSAAVILPKDDSFEHSLMKDSKRFSSDKSIRKVADYIKKRAIAWGVGYVEESLIDTINIRQATFIAMHKAIQEVVIQHRDKPLHLLVDGNDFKPYMYLNSGNEFIQLAYTCIKGGDNKYTSIAAASILAKVARDDYIVELCKNDITLDERYGILKNKGYGTKTHLSGIKEFGITKYHRKSFGLCKDLKLSEE